MNYHRYPGEIKPSDPGQYANLARWCAICGVPRPQLGGSLRAILGGRHWVCSKHPKAPK